MSKNQAQQPQPQPQQAPAPQPAMYAPPPQGMYPPQPGMQMYGGNPPPMPQAGGMPGLAIPGLYGAPVTQIPVTPCDPRADAEKLFKAMKGAGTNEQALIDVLAPRTPEQRQQIAVAYAAAHGDLAKRIHGETSGHFRKLLLALLVPHAQRMADIANEAMDRIGTNDRLLIDVIATATPQEMAALKTAYADKYKKPLAKAIESETSGNYRKTLLALVETARAPPGAVGDPVKVQSDAELLYHAGEHRLGTDEAAFIRVMTQNSAEHMALVSAAYAKLHGKTLEAAIESETSGHFQDVLLALCKPRAAHFATRVKRATKGMGTKDDLLVDIFTLNDRMQLKQIVMAYNAMYTGENMASVVASDTSGDYRRLLLALLD